MWLSSGWQSCVVCCSWALGVAFHSSLPMPSEPAVSMHSTRCTITFAIVKCKGLHYWIVPIIASYFLFHKLYIRSGGYILPYLITSSRPHCLYVWNKFFLWWEGRVRLLLVLVMNFCISLQDNFIYKEFKIPLKKMCTNKLLSISQWAAQNANSSFQPLRCLSQWHCLSSPSIQALIS